MRKQFTISLIRALCCDTKGCVIVGIWKQLTSSILTVKQHWAKYLVGVVYLVISSVADINAVKVYSID